MSLTTWNKDNILKFSIDHTKIDKDLVDFPVLLNLSTDSGKNNYDCSDIFDELTTEIEIFHDDFSDCSAWIDVSGASNCTNGYLQQLNPSNTETINIINYSNYFYTSFMFKNHGRGSGDDQLHIYIVDSTDQKMIYVFICELTAVLINGYN
jgi:hypothetical protein